MKTLLLSSALLFSVAFIAPAALRAQDGPPGASQNKPKTALEKQMDIINKSMRALKKSIPDASQNDASLQSVAAIHDAGTAALTLTPAKAADLSGDAKDKFMADYQAGMKEFISTVDQLSAALKAGNSDEAAKIYAMLPDLEKKDHKEFRKPQQRGGMQGGGMGGPPPAPAS